MIICLQAKGQVLHRWGGGGGGAGTGIGIKKDFGGGSGGKREKRLHRRLASNEKG
jgi:hypothetical protein